MNVLIIQESGLVLPIGRSLRSRQVAQQSTGTIVFQLGVKQLRRMLMAIATLRDGSFFTEVGQKVPPI